MNGSGDIELDVFDCFRPFLAQNGNFRLGGEYIFYEARIETCVFWLLRGVNDLFMNSGSGVNELGVFYPFWPFLAQNGYFRWSEGYTLYQTLIETYIFYFICGVNQLSTMNGSGDIELGIFNCFRPFLAQNGNFRLAGEYIFYEAVIETWVFWLFWGVSELFTSSGSRDNELGLFCPFLPFLAQK